MKHMKTRAVKNKEIAMKLVSQGFDLLNVTKSRDDDNKLVYIFEDCQGFREAFNKILESLPKKDNDLKLDDFEKKFIVELLDAKRRELKSLGIKSTATIDGIIVKLSMDYFDNSEKANDGLTNGADILRASKKYVPNINAAFYDPSLPNPYEHLAMKIKMNQLGVRGN